MASLAAPARPRPAGHHRRPSLARSARGSRGPRSPLTLRRAASTWPSSAPRSRSSCGGLADGLDAWPDGFETDVDGAGRVARPRPARRPAATARSASACSGRCASGWPSRTRGLSVRRELPPLSYRQVAELPAALQQAHGAGTPTTPPDGARAERSAGTSGASRVARRRGKRQRRGAARLGRAQRATPSHEPAS